MKLHELERNIKATHRKKRVGRGPGSGLGKTSGRDKKDKKHVVVVALIQFLKVDNYHYIEEFLKEDFLMLNSKLFMLA